MHAVTDKKPKGGAKLVNGLNVKSTSLALGATSAVVYAICATLFWIAPTQTISLFASLFHGIDITKIAMASVSFTNTITGLIVITISGLLIGALFAKIYNYFVKR